MRYHSFHHKSRSSAAILAAIIAMALIAFIVIVAAIGLIATLTGSNSGAPGGGGGLCTSVPAPYNDIFQKAGAKWQVQPAFIAAIFYIEHGKSWPDANGPWATSPAGAQGPFQFLPSTWETNKQDGNGDGVMDIQNIWDASFAAAYKLDMSGAGGNTTDLDKLRDVASMYNSGRPWSVGQGFAETAKYVPNVIEAYQSFYCATTGNGDIVAIAVAELGTSESNDNCDCGAIEKYGGPTGQPWCAYFVSWVYTKAGDSITFSGRGSASALYDWFGTNQINFARGSGTPQPGDMVYFNYSHVGIVEKVDNDGTLHTIEGNTSNGTVKRETHNINDTDIVGYGRWKK